MSRILWRHVPGDSRCLPLTRMCLSGWIWSWLILAAPAAPALTEKVVQVPAGQRIAFDYPSTWIVKEEPADGPPMSNLTLTNPADSSTLLVTLFAVQPGATSADLKTLRSMLITGTKPIAQTSVEKRTRISSYQTTNVFGVYATFTIASYRSTPPPPGQFKYYTSFVVNCSQHVATFTFMSNAAGSKALDPVLGIVSSLRKLP